MSVDKDDQQRKLQTRTSPEWAVAAEKASLPKWKWCVKINGGR